MSKSIANVRLVPSEHKLRLEWQMVITGGNWAFPFDNLEVRLYCDPFPDLSRPELLFTDIDDFQVTRTRSGSISTSFLGGSKGREKAQKAFRPGAPLDEKDGQGRFYPLHFDLGAIPHAINNGTGLLGVEWEVRNDWWTSHFRCYAVFGCRIPMLGFNIGQFHIEHKEPQSYEHTPMTHASITVEAAKFSTTLKEQLARAHRIIDELTAEQYRILEFLHGHRRVAINGCAGSGKTLLAIEKAIRLDRAGSRTLILCHNPYLANYIQQLTTGTRIAVHDFITWIQEVNGNISSGKMAWTRYQEPSGEELTQAFDNVLEKPAHQYDAIIVDEGQDFKEEWWIVAEAALENNQSGIFYVFYDDNQKLLRDVSNFPLIQAPFKLDKNCRNTGEVFRVVKKFHLQAPEVSLRWGKVGVVRKWVCSNGAELRAIEEAIQVASEVVSLDELVILTTEAGSSENSILINQRVHVRPRHTWQDEINYVLPPMKLGTGVLPKKAVVRNISAMARSILGIRHSDRVLPPPGWGVTWGIVSDSVRLMVYTPTGRKPFCEIPLQHRRDYPVYDEAIFSFFGIMSRILCKRALVIEWETGLRTGLPTGSG